MSVEGGVVSEACFSFGVLFHRNDIFDGLLYVPRPTPKAVVTAGANEDGTIKMGTLKSWPAHLPGDGKFSFAGRTGLQATFYEDCRLCFFSVFRLVLMSAERRCFHFHGPLRSETAAGTPLASQIALGRCRRASSITTATPLLTPTKMNGFPLSTCADK